MDEQLQETINILQKVTAYYYDQSQLESNGKQQGEASAIAQQLEEAADNLRRVVYRMSDENGNNRQKRQDD